MTTIIKLTKLISIYIQYIGLAIQTFFTGDIGKLISIDRKLKVLEYKIDKIRK